MVGINLITQCWHTIATIEYRTSYFLCFFFPSFYLKTDSCKVIAQNS